MSPWNTDIFTYGGAATRAAQVGGPSIAAGDRFVVIAREYRGDRAPRRRSARSTHRLVRDLRPFGPDRLDHPALAAQFGWPVHDRLPSELPGGTNLDVVLRHSSVHGAAGWLILAARGRHDRTPGWVNDLGDAVRMHAIAPPDLPSCARRQTWPCRWRRPTPACLDAECMAPSSRCRGRRDPIDKWITGRGGRGRPVPRQGRAAPLLRLMRDPGCGAPTMQRARGGERLLAPRRGARASLPRHAPGGDASCRQLVGARREDGQARRPGCPGRRRSRPRRLRRTPPRYLDPGQQPRLRRPGAAPVRPFFGRGGVRCGPWGCR
jgi:hypothetical protein